MRADDGVYRLAESFAGRRSMLDAGRVMGRGRWDGSWWTVVALSDRRALAERTRLAAMTAALLGELRPDVWLRPANLDVTVADDVLLTHGTPAAGMAAVLSRPGCGTCPRCSQPPGAAGHRDGAGDEEPFAGGDRTVLPETFIISVAVTRALSAEPRLPDELTGPAWPADPLTGATACSPAATGAPSAPRSGRCTRLPVPDRQPPRPRQPAIVDASTRAPGGRARRAGSAGW